MYYEVYKEKTMKKIRFHSEIAYLLGIISLAFGCAFMERADFGLSMVVAPAYILYLKCSEFMPFLTFGMTEYVFQAFLLIIMIIILRKFRLSYFFSFVTAVIYGYTLNGSMALVALLGCSGLPLRIVFYIIGTVLCSLGVAFMLHTYIPAEVYELIVKEVPSHFHIGITKFKTVYDICSCLVGIVMSFSFFGFGVFRGVKFGTVLCAFVNGFLIGKISGFMDRKIDFRDAFPIRRIFDGNADKRM